MRVKLTNKKDGKWHNCFVFLPVESECKAFLFFEKAQKRWDEKKFISLDFLGHAYSYGGWDYRIIQND